MSEIRNALIACHDVLEAFANSTSDRPPWEEFAMARNLAHKALNVPHPDTAPAGVRELVGKWSRRGDEWALQLGGLNDGNPAIVVVNTITREIDRCRHELEQALAALPDGDGDGMLPDALVPHAKEWYSLCERAPHATNIGISGELAEAIVSAICARRVTHAPQRGGDQEVGEMDRTAPPNVWLQIDTAGDNDDRDEPLPRDCWDQLTWHYESIGGQEVVYIRADLVAALHVAQERGQVDDAAVERACAEMWPTWKNHALRTDEDRERMRRCLAAAADGERADG